MINHSPSRVIRHRPILSDSGGTSSASASDATSSNNFSINSSTGGPVHPVPHVSCVGAAAGTQNILPHTVHVLSSLHRSLHLREQ